MNSADYLMDLRALLRALRERQDRNVTAIRAIDRELTPIEEARFDVGWRLLRDVIMDIEEMESAWTQDVPAYRVTENARRGRR